MNGHAAVGKSIHITGGNQLPMQLPAFEMCESRDELFTQHPTI